MKLMRVICITLIVVVIGMIAKMPEKTRAQEFSAGDFFFETIPANPRPNQLVMVRLQSYAADLDTASVVWTLNNRTIESGIGAKEVSITAGPSDSSYTLQATVTTGGSQFRLSTLIQPSSVDLVWEAIDSYTPPFYKGKALAAGGSRIQVSAFVSSPNPRSTVYAWERNGIPEQRASGVGKNSFTFIHNEVNPVESISVSTRNTNTINGSGAVAIRPINPSIIVYEKRGGFVQYSTAYTDIFTMNNPGTTLRIEPFYFSVPRSLEDDLSFALQIGDEVPQTASINEVQLSRPDIRGQQTLSIGIEKFNTILQAVEKKLLINF